MSVYLPIFQSAPFYGARTRVLVLVLTCMCAHFSNTVVIDYSLRVHFAFTSPSPSQSAARPGAVFSGVRPHTPAPAQLYEPATGGRDGGVRDFATCRGAVAVGVRLCGERGE